MAWSWLGSSHVLRLVILDSSLQLPGQEKHFGIIFTPFCDVAREYLYIHGGRDNGRPRLCS